MKKCRLCENNLCTRSNYVSITGLCRNCYRRHSISGEKIGTWKGGKTHDKKGYVYINISTIKNSHLKGLVVQTVLNRSYGTYRSGRTYEHHIEMIKKLDRSLVRGEVVHHINGDKQDNRIENLILTTQMENRRMHKEIVVENYKLKEEIKELRSKLLERKC